MPVPYLEHLERIRRLKLRDQLREKVVTRCDGSLIAAEVRAVVGEPAGQSRMHVVELVGRDPVELTIR